MLHDSKLMGLLSNPDIHPVDLHEALQSAETSSVRILARITAQWTASETYAWISGQILGSMHDFEAIRRSFFPFMPAANLESFADMRDMVDRHTAEFWGRYLDGIDLLQGKPAKTKEHIELWRHLTTTPGKIAQTPYDVVWQHGIVRLLRYKTPADAEPRKRIPLILVFAVMNTPWVLDLYPGNSFVEHMVQKGYDVYLVDWGSPTSAEKDWTFETYALNLLPQIVATVKKLSESDEFSMLGWCLGAVITTIYAAMRPADGLKNLILLTAPLSFSAEDDIEFRRWLKYIDVPKLLAMNGGLMPAQYIKAGSQNLKPIENSIGNYLGLWHHLDDTRFVEMWSAMNTWLSLNVPMAGALYSQLTDKFYLGNHLTDGRFEATEGIVKLANVRADVLAIIAESDHITPPPQTARAIPLFERADKTVLRMPGGHVGVMVGGAAKKKAWPALEGWLASRS